MYYQIKHVTRFRYSAPIYESIMETRMQPRTEGAQRCYAFELRTSPRATLHSYRDPLGNIVHHFDIPQPHQRLELTSMALVQMEAMPEALPPLPAEAWEALDAFTATGAAWDFLHPSHFVRATPLLVALAESIDLRRRDDPLTLLRELTHTLYETFDYAPQSTRVDSPIDEALAARRGVCQDYAHVMIALVRRLGIPCRYVSGYLFHRTDASDRSAEDATHAWVEAWLPDHEWVGFDPTNDLLAGARHIRVAVGRDYADVPPTRGVFKGTAESELEVAVQVTPTEAPPREEPPVPTAWALAAETGRTTAVQMQQQQQ